MIRCSFPSALDMSAARVACCESANAYAMDDVPVQSPVGSADLT